MCLRIEICDPTSGRITERYYGSMAFGIIFTQTHVVFEDDVDSTRHMLVLNGSTVNVEVDE